MLKETSKCTMLISVFIRNNVTIMTAIPHAHHNGSCFKVYGCEVWLNVMLVHACNPASIAWADVTFSTYQYINIYILCFASIE